MQAERHIVDITTDGSGAGTGYTGFASGRVLQVQYVPDGSVPFSNAHSCTVTGEVTGLAILTKASVSAAFTALPRMKTQLAEDGTDALYAAAGTNVRDAPAVGNERVKIVVASGGAAKAGRYHVTIG